MVLDPPRQPVSVNRMIVYSLIPILNIYAAWRIQMFWIMVGISIASGIAIFYPAETFIPDPYGFIVALTLDGIVSVLATKYFAVKYNKRMGVESAPANPGS